MARLTCANYCARKLNVERLSMVCGDRPPADQHEMADYEAVKRLSPELKAEREAVIGKMIRVEWLKESLNKLEAHEELIARLEEIRNGR